MQKIILILYILLLSGCSVKKSINCEYYHPLYNIKWSINSKFNLIQKIDIVTKMDKVDYNRIYSLIDEEYDIYSLNNDIFIEEKYKINILDFNFYHFDKTIEELRKDGYICGDIM